MAPFRNRDRSNRSGRGQIEHNVLEGLPINQYKEVEVTVGANSADNKPVDKDAWPELPMPRDSHMLPEHSQQLLRAARSGRVFKPPAPPEDDNEMKDEEEEHKEIQTGFMIKKYVKVARHLEVSEPEYLAKRRKGLPSPYIVNGAVQPALRETKVKKLDAEGNATVYKVLVPEGQAVEGEVQPTDAAIEATPATAAPGTVVEGVGSVNAEGVVVANDVLQTPPRRRIPPPKKRKAGPGRSKKKVVFIEGAAGQGTPEAGATSDQLAVPGVTQEGGSVEPSDGDTPMANAGGDEEEGSGEEGSEDEANDTEHPSAPQTPATPSRPSAAPTSVPNLDTAELASLETAASAAPAPVPVGEDEQMQSPPREIVEPVAQLPIPGVEELKTKPDPSSSPDLPVSISHSRQNSINQVPTSATEPEPMVLDPVEPVEAVEPVQPIVSPVVPLPVEPAVEAVVESTLEPVIAAPAPTLPSIVESLPQPQTAPVVENNIPATLEPEVQPTVEEPILEAKITPEPAQPIQDENVDQVEAPVLPAQEQASAPPSEPDLMGSLERHLEQGSEDMGGSGA